MNPKYLFTNVNNYAPSNHSKNVQTPLYKQSKKYKKFQDDLVSSISHTQLFKESFENNNGFNGLSNNNNLNLNPTSLSKNLKQFLVETVPTTGQSNDNNMLLNNYNNMLHAYQILVTNTLNAMKDYVTSLRPGSNPYLGKNIEFSNGTIAYVTQMGVVKPYKNGILNSTSGNNGCPSNNPIRISIPWQNSFLTANTIISMKPFLISGTQMVQGQSCGNEGSNILINNILNNNVSQDLNYEGCYKDDISSPMMNYLTPINTKDPNSSQIYSFDDCKSSAIMNGYNYFGLQNVNNTTNLGICSLSNDLSIATSLGKSTSENNSTSNCNKLFNSNYYGGSSNTNAIYGIKPVGNKSLINNIYYVNPNAELYSYPSQDIDISTNYTTFSNYDSPNNALSASSNGTLEECQNICNSNSKCAGFIYDKKSQTCFPKSSGMWPNENGVAISSNNRDMYVKNKRILNAPFGIHTTTTNVDSLTGLNYGGVKGIVSENEKENLLSREKLNVYKNIQEIQLLETQLNNLASQLERNNMSIEGKNKSILNKSMSDRETLMQMVMEYNDINDQSELKSINGILQDSTIVVTQKNYSYVLWSIVAITVILFTVAVIRK
jgi:hypothetical protein